MNSAANQSASQAQMIDGKALARDRRGEIKEAVTTIKSSGKPCRLVVIRLKANPSADFYNRQLANGCQNTGIDFDLIDRLDADSTDKAISVIEELNQDPNVSGIILQMPVPDGVDGALAQASITKDKDVERVSPTNIGLVLYEFKNRAPCTAAAAMELALSTGKAMKGKTAVVVGSSVIVGKPLAHLALQQKATVTICHRFTEDLASHTKRADFLFVAVGKAGLITGDMIKPGAVIVDVGTNAIAIETDQGPRETLVGDVVFDEAVLKASHITPVPGGVGPMTIAIVLGNVLSGAQSA